MMKIMLTIEIALTICAAFYVMRYNLHMFQLNGYKNQEHVSFTVAVTGAVRMGNFLGTNREYCHRGLESGNQTVRGQ